MLNENFGGGNVTMKIVNDVKDRMALLRLDSLYLVTIVVTNAIGSAGTNASRVCELCSYS